MLVSPGASVNYVPLSLSLSLSFPLLLSISLFLSLANRAWDRARPPGILVHIAAVHISGVLARLAAGNEQGQLQALDRSPITRYHDRSRRSERKHTRDQGQSLLGTYRSTGPTTTGQTPRCCPAKRDTLPELLPQGLVKQGRLAMEPLRLPFATSVVGVWRSVFLSYWPVFSFLFGCAITKKVGF